MLIQQLIRYNIELQLYTKLYHGHENNTVFFSGKEGIKHEVAFVLKKSDVLDFEDAHKRICLVRIKTNFGNPFVMVAIEIRMTLLTIGFTTLWKEQMIPY